MLLSDTWQPAVLQLLPFSTNDACNPQPTAPRLRAMPTPDYSRGYPVLAVTRQGEDGGASDSLGSGGRVGATGLQTRAVSERLTRSHTLLDSASLSPSPRAKSEYHSRHSGTVAPSGITSRSSGGSQLSRDQTTCAITDMNERIVSHAALRADSTSPESGAGSARTTPFAFSSIDLGLSNGGSNGRGLPKPAFMPGALLPGNNSTAAIIGQGQEGSGGDGRYLVSKNGLWRSVTLTPGEMELKKHRDQLDRVTSGKQNETGDSKVGHRYHKMNVRDLPRSTTPVNDHDPDKLNMKQVIAFLQSKGKSQADAVELPREVKGKVNQRVADARTAKSGVMRGSVRKATPSSIAAEVCLKRSGRHNGEDGEGQQSSPKFTQRGEEESEVVRSVTSMPSIRRSLDRPSTRSWRSPAKEHGSDGPDTFSDFSPGRPQKKPFRLHRFLTMVPTARDPVPVAASASIPTTSSPRPVYCAAPTEVAGGKSAQNERTLCLDLASQSKSHTSQTKPDLSKSHTAKPRGGGAGQGSEGKVQSRGSGVGQGSDGKVQYRVSVARPRPSSLRVEQDATEAQWKLSADFGDRDNGMTGNRPTGARDSTHDAFSREERTVIRLPFVSVDSEDEDTGVAETRQVKKLQISKSTKSSKSSFSKPETPKMESWGVAVSDTVWTSDLKGTWPVDAGSEVSMSSVVKSLTPTGPVSGLATQSPGHVLGNQVQLSEEELDVRLPDVGIDSKTPDAIKQISPFHKKVKVNVPVHGDQPKREENVYRQKAPECVTLSLRKERHRTRERTYMSEIGGSDACSDDICAPRVNSDSIRMSLKSDDTASWTS